MSEEKWRRIYNEISAKRQRDKLPEKHRGKWYSDRLVEQDEKKKWARINKELEDREAGITVQDRQLLDKLDRNEIVERVVDGDTVRNQWGNSHRFFAVDAFEKDQGQLGKDASAWVESELTGKKAKIVNLGTDGRGRYISKVVSEDGRDLNLEAVRRGYALNYREYWENISPKYAKELEAAEEEARANKAGYWGEYADASNKETPQDYRRRKEIETNPEQYFKPKGQNIPKEKEGSLERIGAGFDYLGNAQRSAIVEAFRAPEGHRTEAYWNAFAQAMANERYTSEEELRDAVNLRIGHGKVRFGVDGDGKWTFGDFGDTLTNLGISIVTDPLSWATLGVGGAIKAGTKAALVGTKLAAAAQRMAPAGSSLWRAEMVRRAPNMAVGGMMGWGATNEDDSIWAKAGAVGAGIALGTGKTLKAADFAVKKTTGRSTIQHFERASDWYVDKYRKAQVDPRTRQIFEEMRDGTFETKIVEAANLQVPANDPQRLAKVRKIVNQEKEAGKARVWAVLKAEAEKIVDEKWKIDLDTADPKLLADNMARRNDLINSVANSISDVVFTTQKRSVVAASEKLVKEKLAGLEKMVSSGFYGARKGHLPETVEKVDVGMRHLREKFIKRRNTYAKKEGYDFNYNEPGHVVERVRVGDVTRVEIERAIVIEKERFAQYVKDFGAQLAREGKTANDINAIIAKVTKKHEARISSWRNTPILDSKNAGFLSSALIKANERILNDLTTRAIKSVKRNERDILKGASDEVKQLHKDLVENNKYIVDQYNNLVFETKKTGRKLVGNPWHTAETFDGTLAKAADELVATVSLKRQKLATKEKGTGVAALAGEEKAFDIYAQAMAKNFLSETEKNTLKIMNGYRMLVAQNPVMRTAERILDTFDSLTNVMKVNQLYLSMSWFKTNYWDNLGKSYLESGVMGAVDAATLGRANKEIRKDLGKIIKGEFRYGKYDESLEAAVELGVLEGPAFTSLLNEKEIIELNKGNALVEAYKANQKDLRANWAEKFADWYTTGLQNSMGRLGSYMESSARYVTWKHLAKNLEKKGWTKEAARQEAAKHTKAAFNDYSDITKMEAAVFKRLIPYYSFYSKNTAYWMGLIGDDLEKVGRAGVMHKVRDSIGKDVSAEERKALSPYLAGANPRSLGTTASGDKSYVISPNLSFDDAVNFVFDPGGAVKEKLHPYLKFFGYELPKQRDTFDDSGLTPSAHKEKKRLEAQLGGREFKEKDARKFLYSAGFKLVAMQKIGEVLFGKDWAGIKVDERGNPYAEKDEWVLLNKFQSVVFPLGFLDQLAGSIGKVANKKETLIQALNNRISLFQEVKVSKGQLRRRRQELKKAAGE